MPEVVDAARRGLPTVDPGMVARRTAALLELRASDGLSDTITDPVAWQRKVRKDRPLPGHQ